MIILISAAAVLADVQLDAAPAENTSITVTGTRLPDGARETAGRPGGADLVSATDYEDRLAVSLRDALAFSPGIYAQPRFGQEVRLSIRGSGLSRGYHMRGLTLLQDGVPINLADDNGDFQELDPSSLDHLEIYRGANAFRFGGTTLGGAINGVSPTGRTSPGIRFRADGGTFDTLRGQASYGWASPGLDAWLQLSGDRSDGDRQHAERHSLRAHGNLTLALSDISNSRFAFSANQIRQELPGGLTFSRVLKDPAAGSFAGNQQRNVDSLRLQNRTRVRLETAEIEFGGFLNAKSLDHPIFQVVDQDSMDHGVFGRIAWARGPLELLAGATARFGTVDSKRFANLNGKPGGPTFAADQSARTIDLYGEARWTLGRATLVGGAIMTDGSRRQHQTFPLAVSGKAKFKEVSPRLGLLWQAHDHVTVYANLSRSHELPGFIELAQVAQFVPLQVQHAWTAELGGRGTLGPATFDVSLYRALIRNELLQYSLSPDIPASTFNADRTLHQGVEAGLDLKIASSLTLRQVYQFNDFRFRDDVQYAGNRLPVVPKHLYRAEVRVGGERTHLAPSLEWVPRGAWADYSNNLRVGGYALLGVTASTAVSRRAEIFLDARNLTNRRAVGDIGAVVDYQTLQPAQRSIFYPVERRASYVGVRARL